MKTPAFAFAVLGALLATGCGHLDVAPQGNPNRVLTGTVSFRSAVPAGAQIAVRVVDTSPVDRSPATPRPDLPLADRGRPPAVGERVLGEQTITLVAATTDPVRFQVEFTADDAELRHGLNVDARVSYNGRVRLRMLTAQAVTPTSIRYPQELSVEPVQ
jgi:uncharacterized lipoprotein YbaY